jgi:hypothetical protein
MKTQDLTPLADAQIDAVSGASAATIDPGYVLRELVRAALEALF